MAICPLMSKAQFVDNGKDDKGQGDFFVNCKENKCALWVNHYTSEHTLISCCALVMLACKNTNGLYQV